MDSFINKLTEEYSIKPSDFTVFDIQNSSDGLFYTNKISYLTLTTQLSNDLYAKLKAILDALQTAINNANTNIAKKLDKQGLSFGPNEKMTGTLSVNATLSVTGVSYFTNLLTVSNNFISMVRDPVSPQDAVNFRTLTGAINALSIPNGNDYIKRAGDIMTGGFITAATDAPPTNGKHLANKKYVDDQVAIVDSKFGNLDSRYVFKAGDTMLGSLFLTGAPQQPKEAATKKYVDDSISNIVIPNVAGFVIRTGDTMLGSFYLTGAPQSNNEAANKKYVDDRFGSITIPNVAGFVVRSGDTMTGSLYLTGAPQTNNEAANKKYVDDRTSASTTGYATITYVDSTFVRKNGDTMTGSLYLTGAPQKPKEAATKQYVDDRYLNLGAGYATKIYVDDTFVQKSGDTMTGSLVLKGFSEQASSATGAGIVTLDMDEGNTFSIQLTNHVLGFTLLNAPTDSFSITLFIKQTGNYDVRFNINGSESVWANGGTPTMNYSGKTDVFSLTRVGGIWFGFNGGQNFNT